MKRAIDETNRRRALQMAYNEEHGIVPTTVTKDVRGVIQTYADVTEENAKGTDLAPKTIEEQIAELTLLMNKAAQELEFEQAARYRDEITRIKKQNDME
jgi:excinuclease ABC subunit B